MKRSTQIPYASMVGWLLTLAMTCYAPAAPAGPGTQALQQLAGEWSGTVMVKDRPVAVNLKLSGTESGADGTEFHYGVPRSCGLNAEYSGEGEGKQFFSFTTSNGGVCDQLIGGFLAARLGGDGTLTFDATSNDGQTSTSGTLRRPTENTIGGQLTGQWSGQVMAGGRPIRLEVSVLKGSIGDDGAQLRYGAPRSCQLSAEYEGIWNGQAAFGIKSATGGFCDRLTTGLIVMSAPSGGTLGFNITFPDGAPGDNGTLQKSP